MSLPEKARVHLTDGEKTPVPFLHIYRYADKVVPLPQTQAPYVYFVLDGELRLYTPGGIMDYGSRLSGRPLLWDGKRIGAVTRALINDPTSGYEDRICRIFPPESYSQKRIISLFYPGKNTGHRFQRFFAGGFAGQKFIVCQRPAFRKRARFR